MNVKESSEHLVFVRGGSSEGQVNVNDRIIVVVLIVLCLGVEFLCRLHLMCVFITFVRVG